MNKIISKISKEDMLTLYHKLGSFSKCARSLGCDEREWARRWSALDCESLVDCKDFIDTCLMPSKNIASEGSVNANSFPKKKDKEPCDCGKCGCGVGTPSHTHKVSKTAGDVLFNSNMSNNWESSVNYPIYNTTTSTVKVENIANKDIKDKAFWEKKASVIKSEYDPSSERYEIALIADLHLGSIHQQLSVLNNFVDLCLDRDIRTLLNAGDISEGLMPRVGAKNDRFLHVIDDLTEYCVENLPDGFETNAFIIGNHDDSIGVRCDGFDIGKAIQMARGDLTYLRSKTLPDMITVDGGINVQLFHGTGGCTKFRSTRTQNKTFELLAMARQPDIIAFGHCHLASMIPKYCGTYVYGLGCFQTQTKFLADKMMEPDVCGLIIGYNINETTGKMINVSSEFVYADELGGTKLNDF